MWKMYTNPASGIRIKLKKNPFLWHDTFAKDIVQKTGIPLSPDSDPNGKIHSFLDLSELMQNGYYSVQAFGGAILDQVVYTDDLSLLEPKILKQDDKGTSLELGSLGIHKSSYWSFQKEWRYRMLFMNMNFNGSPEEMEQKAIQSMVRLIQGVEKPPLAKKKLRICKRKPSAATSRLPLIFVISLMIWFRRKRLPRTTTPWHSSFTALAII